MLFSNCKIRQKNLFQSFMDKSMKANLGKCHFICSTNDTLICSTNDTLNLFVENQIIHNIKCEKVLVWISIMKLTFNSHWWHLQKNGDEVQCLNKDSNVHGHFFLKKKLLVNAFFMSQFNYCPLVWMYNNRTKNNKINMVHERCLRLIYNNKLSSLRIKINLSLYTVKTLRVLQSKSVKYVVVFHPNFK